MMTASKAKPWPKSGESLRDAGYHSQDWGTCRGCDAPILWTKTPAGKMMPLFRVGDNSWMPHWINCKARNQFQKKKAKA